IKDFVVGQKVQSWKDNQNNNLTIYNGEKQVYEYKLKTGYTIRLTPDHKVYTMEMGEIPIDVAYENRLPIAIPKRINLPETNTISAGKARILGLLLGDGSFTQSSYTLTTKDDFIVEDFRNLIESEFPESTISV